MSRTRPRTEPAAAALSVVIVARNEAEHLPALLADLARGRERITDLVVVDGDSSDGSAGLAHLAGARVIHSRPCRGGQLATGVAATQGAWLLLLHADARLPDGWPETLARAMAARPERAWSFRLAIDAAGWPLRLVEALVGLRSRWRSLPYGDQGLLVPRTMLQQAGGIAALPLMEDLDLVLRLRRRRRIGLLPQALRVSGRRWRRLGVLRTGLANARLRRAWRRGEDPTLLAATYYEAGPTAPGGSG